MMFFNMRATLHMISASQSWSYNQKLSFHVEHLEEKSNLLKNPIFLGEL